MLATIFFMMCIDVAHILFVFNLKKIKKIKSEKEKIELPLFIYSRQISSQDYVCYLHVFCAKMTKNMNSAKK